VNPEFRVFLEPKCIVNPPPIPVKKKRAETPAIVALLLPKLIELAISGVATLLKKRAPGLPDLPTLRLHTA